MMRLIEVGHRFDRLLGQRDDILLLHRSRILDDGGDLLSRRSNGRRWNGGRLRNHRTIGGATDRILDRHVRIDLVRHYVVRYGGGRTDRGRNRSRRTLLIGHSIRWRHLWLRTGGYLHHLLRMNAVRIESRGRLLFRAGRREQKKWN